MTPHPAPQPPGINQGPSSRRPGWRRLLKWTCLTLLALLLLVAAAVTVAVSWLKPERLTPMVENIAGQYMRADLKARRIELSFWSTFPRLDLHVDGLQVRTRALDSLPDSVASRLPVWADSLLSLRHLSAGVNLPRLLTGRIVLYDIILDHPAVNLVQATPQAWSLDIFPTQADTAARADTPPSIPRFTMGTFRVCDSLPVRYLSLPDTVSASVTLTALTLGGEDAPVYSLAVRGMASASTPAVDIRHVRLGLGGHIDWDPARPLQASLERWQLGVGDVDAHIDTRLDFSDGLCIQSLSLSLPPTPVASFIDLIPQSMRGELARLDTDLRLGLEVALTRPYTVGADSIPSLTLDADIPPGGSATYDGYNIKHLELQARATVDGLDPDRSTLSIGRLFAEGDGVGFLLTGNLSHPLSDPLAEGTFKGGVDVQRLPRRLLRQIPATVKASLMADCHFNLRRSYLSRQDFHKIRLRGEATLRGLEVDAPFLPASLYSHCMRLDLGTNSSFVRDDASVDSLLTLSVSIDTISASVQGYDLRAKGLKMGAGCRNTAQSSDTTLINPIGAHIQAERLSLVTEADSTRLHLRGALAGASLKRYQGNARQPQLSLRVNAQGAVYGDHTTRAMLYDAGLNLTVHPSSSTRAQHHFARLDSLRRLHPSASRARLNAMADSLAAARRTARAATAGPAPDPLQASIEVDGPLRRLLRNWSAAGHLHAQRMRVFTPLFPLTNRITGLQVDFSTDSLHIRDTRVRTGHSSFTLDGTVANISQALTSRRGRRDLVANFTMDCDTINVNEIAAALFAGAAWADRDTTGAVSLQTPPVDNADEEALQAQVDQAASLDSTSILIIPANLEATFDLKARHIVYSDLVFHDFRGTLNAFGGALNLARLTARSDIGSLGLNALYTAPSRREGTFAFGLTVDRFHIGQFLDLMPQLDTLMPLLHGIDGVVSAQMAATTDLDSAMNIEIPTLKAALRIRGDSLVMLDDATFQKIGKWLLLKNKQRNLIDSMNVEMIVDNSQMQLFPFIFDFDRYRLGVEGTNDMAMNLKYHIAVLKSPIPFKFGINLSGTPDNLKVRLGRARWNDKNMARTVSIADTTRVNLVQQITNIFRRGVDHARVGSLDFSQVGRSIETIDRADTITATDSAYFRSQGLIP